MTGKWAATNTLRGYVADLQDILSAPEVDRLMADIALVETALDAAEWLYISQGGRKEVEAWSKLGPALRAVREGQ